MGMVGTGRSTCSDPVRSLAPRWCAALKWMTRSAVNREVTPGSERAGRRFPPATRPAKVLVDDGGSNVCAGRVVD